VEKSVEMAVKSQPVPRDFHRDYTIEQKIGQGAFGSVYAARANAGVTGACHAAVMVIDLRSQGYNCDRPQRLHPGVVAEVAILRALPKSINIVQFHDCYISEGFLYMVMERCDSGLVRALEGMRDLTERTLQPVFRDMLSAITTCHTMGIVHRDVKPDNFLATPVGGGLIVKLCDFGVSSRGGSAEAAELEGLFGTPPYMAPEMLSGSRYGAKVDVWALGVLAYVLLFGAWPYTPSARSGTAMKAAILRGCPAPRFRGQEGVPDVSRQCVEWVQALLRRSVVARPSARAALKLYSFAAEWRSGPCLRPALDSAKRCGALNAGAARPPTDLDRLLLGSARLMAQMNAAGQGDGSTPECDGKPWGWISDASTAASPRL